MTDKKQARAIINDKPQQVYIMNLSEFGEIAGRIRESIDENSINSIVSALPVAQDLLLARRLIDEVGLTGKAIAKELNGNQYIILKGYPGLRQELTGTRYLANHPKVIDLAIGQRGINNTLVKGARLSIYLTVPLNVLQHLLNEKSTLTQLIGQTATDLTKIGLGTMVGSSAAFVAGTATTIAVGPLIAAIAFGVATTFALDYLDRRFGVSEAVINALDTAHDRTFGELARQIVRFERGLIDEAVRKAVGQGVRF